MARTQQLDTNCLKTIFETLKNSEIDGIPGVVCIDSGKNGPTVGVTICTHGNEPVGLAVAEYLLTDSFFLQSGRLYIICNNIQATECFLNAGCDDVRESSRYLEANMNRLPDDLIDKNTDTYVLPYEWRRSQELYPLWQSLSGG